MVKNPPDRTKELPFLAEAINDGRSLLKDDYFQDSQGECIRALLRCLEKRRLAIYEDLKFWSK